MAVADGAIGIACGFPGVALGRADAVSLRFTPGTLPPSGSVLLFEGDTTATGLAVKPNPAGYAEMRENACAFLGAFLKGRTALIAPGRIDGVTTKGRTTTVYVVQGSRTVEVRNGATRPLRDVIRVPVAGSADAIRRLVAACPAIRADLANDCGV